jgi:putative ABC transport system ATP-binding protein
MSADGLIARVVGLGKFHGEPPGRVEVLRGIDLEIRAGSFTCVMGPSGSGKSTLLHLISGLDEPSTGTIELAGEDLAGLSLGQRTLLRRRTVGYVFQFFNLLPNLSVRENVALPLSIAGTRDPAAHAAVPALLARFGIAARERALPHQLSGGEMQRTSIARALAGAQPLLLADEPTGNLSQQAGLEVMKALREVCDQDGRTILLVTHNPRDATFADEVRFLLDGRIADLALRKPLRIEDVHAALARLAI